MPVIFLSHSSRDNDAAGALRDYLTEEGWNDLFVDFDPQRGIVAGERWERALSEASSRCEAVIFLVSRAWLDSRWCMKEFHLANRLNKRMFGVLIEDLDVGSLPPDLTRTWQLISLAKGHDHRLFRSTLPDGSEAHVTFSTSGLLSLKLGLAKAGLDPRFFTWPPADDPQRPPYRGLRPLEAEDAGIFFGREAPIIDTLDRLRDLAECSSPSLLVILGASGAGKSSFLRAGVLPRLSRDERNFVALPPIRPGRAVIYGETGLIAALQQALQVREIRKTLTSIRTAVEQGAGPTAALLEELTNCIRPTSDSLDARAHSPTIVIAIDQCEELFLGDGQQEAAAFLSLLVGLLRLASPRVIGVMTIRSDSFEAVQTACALTDVPVKTQSLPPLPKGTYQSVIELPAARLRDTPRALRIEPSLTAALLADIELEGSKDALPLLAFTLERIYLEHGGDGDMTLAEYRATGGIRGSIEAAVERALAAAMADPRLPSERGALLALLRRAMIPWLATIDTDTGSPRRRVAQLSEMPEETRPLIEHFIAEHLLSSEQIFTQTDTSVLRRQGEATVEPAHEALLRQWSLLQGWLQEDHAALSIVEGVKRAARDWITHGKDEAWLVHQAGRLDDAEAIGTRDDLARVLDDVDRHYLIDARVADTVRRDRDLEDARNLATALQQAAERQRQVTRRTFVGTVAASLLAITASLLGWYGLDKAREAKAKSEEAKKSTAGLLVTAASSLLDQGYTDEAALLLLDSALSFTDDSAPHELLIGLHRLNDLNSLKTSYKIPTDSTAIEGRDALYFIMPDSKDVLRFDGSGEPAVVVRGAMLQSPIIALATIQNGSLVLVAQNRDVILVKNGSTSPTKVAALAPPMKHDGRDYEEEDENLRIHSDGLLIANQPFSGPGNDEEGNSVQLVDMADGTTLITTLPKGNISYAPSTYLSGAGILRIIGHESTLYYRVDRSKAALSLVPQELGVDRQKALQWSSCLENGLSPYSRTLPTSDFPIGDFLEVRCVAAGSQVFVSTFGSTSAGIDRVDRIIDYENEMRCVQDTGSDDHCSFSNISWLGAGDPDEYTDPITAQIVHRDLIVRGVEGALSALVVSHAVEPGPARVVGRHKIVVALPKNGRVVAYDFSRGVQARNSATLGKKRQLATLNKGTCVGAYEDGDWMLVDARLPNGSVLHYGDPSALVIDNNGVRKSIDFGTAGGCLQFSADWKRMLAVDYENRIINIYDFERILSTGSAAGAKIDSLNGEFSSAFFAGTSHDIITSDYTTLVRRWRKTGADWRSDDFYAASHPVVYAEPNADATLLVLIERVSGADMVASLHSVSANKLWMELATNYKWLGATFIDNDHVAFGNSMSWNRLRLPRLMGLVAEAQQHLGECVPRHAGDYRSSSCWPDARSTTSKAGDRR